MSKLKKLVVTVAALAALAIGGAAFAQAQNSGTATQVPTHRSAGESAAESDGGQADVERNDGPNSASEVDAPEGPHDQADSPDTDQETNDD